ncbi:MAG TPA: response regulator [Nitrospirota bacterium]|nr:response regulator [Nitrospirota bacterium]
MTVKILLADKSITIQKVVEMLFSGRDYEVLCVSDGESALSEASRTIPDVVLADVDLPKMDGYAFSARLRQTLQLAKIPVILMMSRDDVYDSAKGKAAGITDNIAKPFESQDLIAKVKRAVSPVSSPSAEPARPASEQKPAAPVSHPAAAAPPPPQSAVATPKQAAPADIFEIIQEAPTASEVRQAAGLPGGEEETVYEVEPEVEEVEEPMPREVAKALPVGEKAVEEMRAGLGLEEAEEERAEAVPFDAFETVVDAEPTTAATEAAAAARPETAPAAAAPPPLPEGEIRTMVEEAVAKLAKETFKTMPLPQPSAISESDLWGIAEEAVSRMAKEVFAQMPPARTAQPPALPESELRRMAEEAIARMAEDAFKDMPPPPLPKISDETVRRGIEDAVMKVAREIAKEVIERVAWDVIPPLAEQMIREEIERLKAME